MSDTVAVNQNSGAHPPSWKWNALFRGDPKRGSFNACVGNNGAPDIYHYADGYADSVNLLIDSLIKREAMLDTLIYPICFNLRHAVELTVKGLIQDLSLLATQCKRPHAPDRKTVEKVLNQHDILNLWRFFSDQAIAFDRRYNEQISASAPLIHCIADTDPTGQTFRYSYSTEAIKHLTEVSLINVLVLREQFAIIRENLENLSLLTQYFAGEYSAGTFTNTLNREDLLAIARQLPARQSWADPAAGLDAIKLSIKAEYGIGSKELLAAIEKIGGCRDMARLIGLPVNIPGLSAGDLMVLNELWKREWNRDALASALREDIDGVSASPIRFETMQQTFEREQQVRKAVLSSLDDFTQWATEEKLAGLQALLDAGGYSWCEEHDRRFEWYRPQMADILSASPQQRDVELTDIWSRSIGRPTYPSFLIRILRGAGFSEEAALLEENLFS